MGGSDEILTTVEDGILRVTINRPACLNAFNATVHNGLDALWTQFEADPALRVAVITGAGDKAFSAGSDIKYYASGVPIVLPENGYGGLSHRRLKKPIIGAANGLAFGGGFEFLLCCDLVIAAEHATFGLPEVRIGAAALGGGLPRLMRKIPYNVGMGMLLSARPITADHAYRIGLVNEVAPKDKLMDTAMGWARDIMLGAPLAVAATKQVAEDVMRADHRFDDLLAYGTSAFNQAILDSDDCKEGMRAFAEKRPPVWTGR